MKKTVKTIYEEPKLQLVVFMAVDVIASSPFLSEDDGLGNEKAKKNNNNYLVW